MGKPKYSLPFGGETLLQRSVKNLRGAVCPIVIVGAPGTGFALHTSCVVYM